YAADKLADSGQAEATTQHHFEYFLSQAEQAEAHLYGPEQEAWLDRLEIDHSNIEAALSWSLRTKHAEAGLFFALSVEYYWECCTLQREGLEWLEKLLVIAENIPVSMRARALRVVARCASYLGDGRKAAERCHESLTLANEIHDEWNMAWALGTLGFFE